MCLLWVEGPAGLFFTAPVLSSSSSSSSMKPNLRNSQIKPLCLPARPDFLVNSWCICCIASPLHARTASMMPVARITSGGCTTGCKPHGTTGCEPHGTKYGSTAALKARMATGHFKAAATKSTAFNVIGGDRGLQIEMS